MTLVAYGPNHWMIQWETREACERILPSLVHLLETSPPGGFLEYVTGYQTLLLIFAHPISQTSLQTYLDEWSEETTAPKQGSRIIQIPVTYSGPDLNYIAQTHKLSVDEVIQRHSNPTYTVYFMGFSPGFPYLGPLHPSLHTPRRDSPRTRIPAGSVAIGGTHTGIYSVPSAGGWHILGHTPYPLFQLERAQEKPASSREIFSLHPGDQIKFIPQRELTL